MNNLRNLAEQQSNQRENKIKIRILKQTPDKKLSEKLSPITKKLHEEKESNEKLDEIVKKSVRDENTQTPAMETMTTTQSLRDISLLMKGSKKSSNSEKNQMEKYFGRVFPFNHLEKKELMLKMRNML